MLNDCAYFFDRSEEIMGVVQSVESSGRKMKKDHNIVQPWPDRVQPTTAKHESDKLYASSLNNNERCMKLKDAK